MTSVAARRKLAPDLSGTKIAWTYPLKEIADGFGMDGTLVVDTEMFAGKGAVDS